MDSVSSSDLPSGISPPGHPLFGLEMIRELQRHRYSLSPGTLYLLLHRLTQVRYLRSAPQGLNGKVRRPYGICNREPPGTT